MFNETKKLIQKIRSDSKSSNFAYGIIGSLLASAIWQYSPAFLSWLGNRSFGLLKTFIDSRYEKAATLEVTNFSFLIFIIAFMVFWIAWIELSRRIKSKLRDNDENEEKPKERSKYIKHIFLAYRIFIGAILFGCLLFISGETTVMNSIIDFNQHMRIIKPYIDENRYNLLISEWSQMESLDDYNKINQKLFEISKENKLKLKRNKFY